jgi:hypothetical protein
MYQLNLFTQSKHAILSKKSSPEKRQQEASVRDFVAESPKGQSL